MNSESLINIRSRIGATGSISIAEFMDLVIASKDGYYSNFAKISPTGDFITAPELSQLFGEIIALWIYGKWQDLNQPQDYIITELGPGTGSMMNDILRTLKSFKEFPLPKQICFVEISPKMIAKQQALITQFPEIKFIWVDNIFAISQGINIIIGNEFFDALPIEQYVKNKKEWSVVNVTISPENSEFKFSEIPLQKDLSDQLNLEYPRAKHRAYVEISTKSINVIKFITGRIKNSCGAAIFIDYGYYLDPILRENYNSSLQAIKNHQYHPVLHDICTADLSAHVDFWRLKEAAEERGCATKIISQRQFLLENGIEARASSLIAKANPEERKMLSSSFHRLTDKAQMGELFKVLILA